MCSARLPRGREAEAGLHFPSGGSARCWMQAPGECSAQRPCGCAPGASPKHVTSRQAYSRQRSPGFHAAISPKMQARAVRRAEKKIRKLKCKNYIRLLCIIIFVIFSLRAPYPLHLFVSKSSKGTEQRMCVN